MSFFHGDCLEKMRELGDGTIDSIVTDPPYGLSFMGKGWDHGVPGPEFWVEALRVAKPGTHLLAFGGTRTYHRLAVAIEDAGWEIRDCVMWVYGSGFPKSLDVGKAIDRAAGAEREVVGRRVSGGMGQGRVDSVLPPSGIVGGALNQFKSGQAEIDITAPATDAAKQWDGWGTALKPAWEPIIVARKPLCGTVAENVMKHGTGAINVDGCRVAMGDEYDPTKMQRQQAVGTATIKGAFGAESLVGKVIPTYKPGGRWPANVIHDGSDEVVGMFPETTTNKGTLRSNAGLGNIQFAPSRPKGTVLSEGDSGSAARFFYCAKASKRDRDEGCEGLEEKACGLMEDDNYDIKTGSGSSRNTTRRNHHPTVKPTDLMRYLCRLVTPPNGIVLDPFMGSGSTGKAAVLEGFDFVGIEKEADYIKIAEARIAKAKAEKQEQLL